MDGGKRRGGSLFAGSDAQDKTIINQIMLRFRPIAPRPAAIAQSSGRSTGLLTKKRVKRKYNRVKKTKKATGRNSIINDYNNNNNKGWMDFERMREISNRKEFVVTDPFQKLPNWISFGNNNKNNISSSTTPGPDTLDVDLVMAVRRRSQVVESWITMESVTVTCEDGRRLGHTDEEVWKNLDSDSCPGFISSYGEVQWVNIAYRRMVDPNPDSSGGAPPEVVVYLGLGAKAQESMVWPAFSCRLRVVYQSSEEKKTQMTVVPCDVWKMDFGGYAWRLDIEAALSLGR